MAGEDSFKLLSLSGSLREHTRRERGGSLAREGFLSLAEASIRSRFFPCLFEKTEQTVPFCCSFSKPVAFLANLSAATSTRYRDASPCEGGGGWDCRIGSRFSLGTLGS